MPKTSRCLADICAVDAAAVADAQARAAVLAASVDVVAGGEAVPDLHGPPDGRGVHAVRSPGLLIV